MKGRKPEADAVRRGIVPTKPQILTKPIKEQNTLAMPQSVAENPLMCAAWEMLVGESTHYTQADIPLLEQACFYYSVMRQCIGNTIAEDGTITTKVGRIGEDGAVLPETLKTHPDIKVAQSMGAALQRTLAELGATPLARQRMGLMEAVTHSTQAEMFARVREAFDRAQAGESL